MLVSWLEQGLVPNYALYSTSATASDSVSICMLSNEASRLRRHCALRYISDADSGRERINSITETFIFTERTKHGDCNETMKYFLGVL